MSILDKFKSGITTQSPEQTQSYAAELASVLPINLALKLSGTLGTGKTTFVQGLAKAWGIQEPVKSPTFNLYSIYQGNRQLVHLDAYRLNHPSQTEDLLIDEFLKPPFCLAIEWPEKVDGWMDEDTWLLEFDIQDDHSHTIKLRTPESL